MDTLTINLTAIPVDNPSIYTVRTKVDVIMEDVGQGLTVENLEGGPRSLHRFCVSDANFLGCGETYQLTAHQSSFALALACSLANPRALFSTLQPDDLLLALALCKSATGAGADANAILTKDSIIERIGIIFAIEIALEATEILTILDKLITLRLFDRGKRSLLEHNTLSAISQYWEALKSTDGLTCYVNLYDAFEKAVNADRGRRGEAFEAVASNMTGLSVSDIRKLKEFHNHVKLVMHNRGDFNVLEAGEERLRQKALVLKKAADSAILSRI